MKILLAALCFGDYAMASQVSSEVLLGEKTKRVYWDDPELTQLAGAQVLEVGTEVMKDGREAAFVVLDQTIFYPKGGGQPSDRGVIVSSAKVAHLVELVQEFRAESGELTIRHYLAHAEPALQVHERVDLQIDGNLRLLHSQYHSAGHVMERIMRMRGWVATKGNHSPSDAWVEFQIPAEPEDPTELLQQRFAELTAENKNTVCRFVNYQDLEAVLGEAVPRYISPDKPTRVVDLAGLGYVPCGGTHVKRLEQLQSFQVRQVGKWKKGLLKIAYRI